MRSTDRAIAVSASFVAVGGGGMSAYAALAYPEWAKTGFWGGLIVMAIGVAILIWALTRRDAVEHSEVVGIDIDHHGEGPAMRLGGGGPMKVSVTARPGQSATGIRINKSGSGPAFDASSPSTTFSADGGSVINVEDSSSTAHNFANVKGSSSLSARNIRHDPDKGNVSPGSSKPETGDT